MSDASAIGAFKAAQRRFLERFGLDAESRLVEVAAVDGSAHVLTHGEGPPVVMVPGFADPAAMWAPLVAKLDGFETFSVDRPCFGLSNCAPHRSATLRRLAVDFLEQVLDALGLERPLIVGNSIGSLWSLWLALDRPDRVAGMVHIGCPAFLLGTSAPLPMRLLSTRLLGPLLMALLPPSRKQVEAFARAVGGEDLSTLPELADLLVAAQKLPGAQRATRDLLHAVVRLRGARHGIAVTADDLEGVRQPTLLIWGARDVFGPPAVGETAAGIMPRAELAVIQEGGHVPWIGHRDEVAAAALPFLREHASRATA